MAWRGDWNLTVVLQDEAGGAVTDGTLYLTNIHRLYGYRKGEKQRRKPTIGWDRLSQRPRRSTPAPSCVIALLNIDV